MNINYPVGVGPKTNSDETLWTEIKRKRQPRKQISIVGKAKALVSIKKRSISLRVTIADRNVYDTNLKYLFSFISNSGFPYLFTANICVNSLFKDFMDTLAWAVDVSCPRKIESGKCAMCSCVRAGWPNHHTVEYNNHIQGLYWLSMHYSEFHSVYRVLTSALRLLHQRFGRPLTGGHIIMFADNSSSAVSERTHAELEDCVGEVKV
ncbi:hypothetical protein WA026_020826 [Henosepilachna vigintioctopunctata]|uniref:Transposase n=1 Tax=Henosepilachna vigintioctopunctata TaxID=420089 RepID=A0AAW1TXM1_9CUCU